MDCRRSKVKGRGFDPESVAPAYNLLYAICLPLFTLPRSSNRALYRARQLYKNISMLFLFPVKDGKLISTGVNATFVLLFVTKNVEFSTFTQTVMIRTVLLNTGSSPNIE